MSNERPDGIREGLPDLVGRTPLVRLRRLHGDDGPRVFAKIESANPGGSAKDRPAATMLAAALESGELCPGDTVIESSSGNLGVALAQWCRWHDLELICVVDPRSNHHTLRLIEAYGAELHHVLEPDPATGDWLAARRSAVDFLLATTPRSWTPDQYGNPLNPVAHAQGTMREIVDALDGDVAAVFVATSTTGTLQGCQQHLDARGLSTLTVAVDAVGSVLFGGATAPRRLPGFGAGTVPPLAEQARPGLVRRVDDLDCVLGCRRLVEREALLVGASGGGVVTALGRELHRFGPDDNVVLVMHDSGARYLETVFDDAWVAEHLGWRPDPPRRPVDTEPHAA